MAGPLLPNLEKYSSHWTWNRHCTKMSSTRRTRSEEQIHHSGYGLYGGGLSLSSTSSFGTGWVARWDPWESSAREGSWYVSVIRLDPLSVDRCSAPSGCVCCKLWNGEFTTVAGSGLKCWTPSEPSCCDWGINWADVSGRDSWLWVGTSA